MRSNPVCKSGRLYSFRSLAAALFVALSALLTACPGLPAPEEIDFEGDPSILRGAWTGTVGEVVTGSVSSFAFSPDGQFLALAAPGNVFLYNADTLEPAGTLPLGKEYVYSLAFGADNTLATSGTNVSFWDASSTQRLRRLTAVGEVRSFSKDLAVGATVERTYQEMTVKVWDLATETVLNAFEVTMDGVADALSAQVNAVAFSPDGGTLAVADTVLGREHHVSTLRLWNVETGALEKTFRPQSDACSSIDVVAFSPDGKTLAFSECRTTFSLVDIASGKLLPISEEIQVARSFAFSPDGTQLVTERERVDATTDPVTNPVTLDLWNLDGGLVGTFECQGSSDGNSVPAFSADGLRVAVSNASGTVDVWKVADLRRLATLPELEPFKVSLALEASYANEYSYNVEGTLITEAGDVYRLTGIADGGNEHRYIKPAHAAPTPPGFQANAFDADGTLHWTLYTTLSHESASYYGAIQDVSARATGFSQDFSIERP